MKNKLDSELKDKVLCALKSGDYPKAQSALYDGNGYCCLGVVGVIHGVDNNEMFDNGYFDMGNVEFPENYPTFVNYPRAFVRGHEEALEDEILDELMHLNDSNPTFKEVIDFIEENL